jgi:2-phosphosulfolactate phosphatase
VEVGQPGDRPRRGAQHVTVRPHSQQGFDRRFEWGLAGMRQLAGPVDVLVVVDVLSFTTCVDIAVGRGGAVYPAPWRDARAADLAREFDAVLAVGRSKTSSDHPYSLSPASLSAMPEGTRLVLPSPNGATICHDAAARGAVVLAGCIRNAAAVARAAAARGTTVGVIAAGEQWPDGSLRPALEDLVGAGMILDALGGEESPEAWAAVVAGRAATSAHLRECASARELIGRGFAGDVQLAMMPNISDITPILRDGAFTDSSQP